MRLDAERHLRAQRERRSAFLSTSSHPYTTCMLHILSPRSSYRNHSTLSLLASESIQLSPIQFMDNHVFYSHHRVPTPESRSGFCCWVLTVWTCLYRLSQLNIFSWIIFFMLDVLILTQVRWFIAMWSNPTSCRSGCCRKVGLDSYTIIQ